MSKETERSQTVILGRELIVRVTDEWDSANGVSRPFYLAWLALLPDDVIYGIVTRGEPIPEWVGPSAPA